MFPVSDGIAPSFFLQLELLAIPLAAFQTCAMLLKGGTHGLHYNQAAGQHL